MQLLHQLFLIYIKKVPRSYLCYNKKTIAFSKMKNYGSFYNLIVKIFPRNGVSIAILKFQPDNCRVLPL
ncbi:hypothetical protein CDB3_08725 [Bacillus sp. CDB3]|nr:hypothetical protein CDB3_08725 [Bacillus sp. CDB3]